ncbi:MAG: Ig-like domain-containing protein [Treponema sp.]|nr:Ig-like domain-containing protein [Treponema sp.]
MKNPSAIVVFFLMTAALLPGQSGNDRGGIDFTFDFSAVTDDSLQAAVLLYRKELALVGAGETKTVRVPYEDVYYFGYRYGGRNTTEASSGRYLAYDLPLYLSRAATTWTITIPPPPRNPSGLARLRLRNNFAGYDSVRIRVQDENGKHGAIGSAAFSRDEAGNPANADSVLNRGEEREFILEAGRYAIEVIDNNDTVVRTYDSFNLPAAFGPYTIELGEDQVRPSAGIGLLPGQDLGKPVALDQAFEISFSQVMIEPLVEADLQFYANDDPEKRTISLTREWTEPGRKLMLRPRKGWLLSPDTDYRIVLGLNCRDRYGNALERHTERTFRTAGEYQEIAGASVTERYNKELGALKTVRLEWKPVPGADGYELRFFSGGGLSEVTKVPLGGSLQYEVDRAEFRQNDFIEYLLLPYKKIGGKIAYSAAAMRSPRKTLYFTNQNPERVTVKAGIVFDGEELSAAEQQSLVNALRLGLEKAGIQAEIAPAPPDAAHDGCRFVISAVSIAAEEAPPLFGKTYFRGDFSVEFARDGLTLKLAAAAFNDSSRDWVLRGAANWIRDNRGFYEAVIEKLARQGREKE